MCWAIMSFQQGWTQILRISCFAREKHENRQKIKDKSKIQLKNEKQKRKQKAEKLFIFGVMKS
jgi:hypothetical protein